jgi:hypothetical protein
MSRLSNPERVQIWNTLFKEATTCAQALFNNSAVASPAKFKPKGGVLPEPNRSTLMLLLYCTMSIEARANHLIEELEERGKITTDEARAASRLPPADKWFLLPKLAGARRGIKSGTAPHNAVKEICGLRNALMHVDFDKLSKKLPTHSRMRQLYRDFVLAIDDMSIRVARNRKPSRVLAKVSKLHLG